MTSSDRVVALTVAGALAGDLLAAGVFAAADHVMHRSGALGVWAEVLLLLALMALGGLVGRIAGRCGR